MSWYKTGTITVNNGSAAITGSGTAWVANTAAGEAIYLPDGKFYEIASVNSDTSITLASSYTGTSLAGQSYTILPSQSFIRDLAAQAAALINSYASIANAAGVGKFGDGTLGAPGISFINDTNTGIRRTADGTFRLVSNGVDIADIGPSGMALLSPDWTKSLVVTNSGTTVTGPLTAGASVLGGSSEKIHIDKLSDSYSYGAISLNGSMLAADIAGFFGRGSGGDSGHLYANVPSGKTHHVQVNNVDVLAVTSSGLAVTGKMSISDAGSGTVAAFRIGAAQTGLSSVTGSDLAFLINGATGMALNGSGLLSLGTSTPSGSGGGSRLTVESATECAVFKNSGGASYSPTVMWNAVTTGDPYFAYFITENTSYPGTNRGSIDFNRAGGLVRYNTTSDITLKTRLGPAPQSKSVGILESTVLEEYFWNADETKKPQIGPFAQDLYKTFKGAVSVGGMRDVMEDVVEDVFEDVEEDVIENLVGDIIEPVFEDAFNAAGEKIGVIQTGERVVGQGVIGTVKVGTRIVNKKVGEKVVGQRKVGEEYRPWGVDKTAYTFHLVAGFQHHQQRIAELEARLAALEGV